MTCNGMFPRCLCIDFDLLQVKNLTSSYPLSIQRIYHLPPGQMEDIGWYFKDNKAWQEYGLRVKKIPLDHASPSVRKKPSKPFSSSSFRWMGSPPQSAVKISSSCSVRTLRAPLASWSDRVIMSSTLPVRDDSVPLPSPASGRPLFLHNCKKNEKIKANLLIEKSNRCCFTWQP